MISLFNKLLINKNASPYPTRRITVFLAAFLSACGGGGGSSGGNSNSNGGTEATFTIIGTISGLTGTVVLKNNENNDISISTNGSYTFTTSVSSGSSYNVVVVTQPVGQTCTVANGSGTISEANVTNIGIACVASAPSAPVVSVSAANPKALSFDWPAVSGATYYKLSENPDGVSGYSLINGNITTTSINFSIAVHSFDWANARYIVEACNSVGCTATSPFSAEPAMLGAIGTIATGGISVVSSDGNTLAIAGGLFGSGSTVDIYARSNGVWRKQTSLTSSNYEAGDRFGSSIAISSNGNTLAVGAKGEDGAASTINGDQTSNAANGAGAVYVFTRTGGTLWTQQAYIKPTNMQAGDGFGYSVALSANGNTMAIGAPVKASLGGMEQAGGAYIFARSTGNWSQTNYLQPSDLYPSSMFGKSLSLSSDGSILVVGAPSRARNGYWEGAAYVFKNGGQIANLIPSSGMSHFFGESVAVSPDASYLAIGAIGSNSVYMFRGNTSPTPTNWSTSRVIRLGYQNMGDQFGSSLSFSFDSEMLVVGAPYEDGASNGVGGNQLDNSLPDSGAAFIFKFNSLTLDWTQTAYLKAPSSATNHRFGRSVSISGNKMTVLVGADSDGVYYY